MKIVIIDDDKLVATSLKTIVESDSGMEVAAVGHSGEQAIELYEEIYPDVLLSDIRMKGMTGLEAGEIIIKKYPDAKVLYLTTFNDDEYIIKALNQGAKGYIIKQDYESIIPALKAVYEGQNVYGSEVIDKMHTMLSFGKDDAYNKENRLNEVIRRYNITQQELEVIRCVAKGMSNKEIAGELYLSEGTVRNYLSNILQKLDIRDRTNLAIFYLQLT